MLSISKWLGKWYRTPDPLHQRNGDVVLPIVVQGKQRQFESVGQFSDFLTEKIGLPPDKAQDIASRSDSHLQQEIRQLNALERTMTDKLVEAIQNPNAIGDYLKNATIVHFSQDHEWRQILYALSQCSSRHNQYKLKAIQAYIQYLRSRIDLAQDKVSRRSVGKTDFDTMQDNQSDEQPQYVVGEMNAQAVKPDRLGELKKIPRGVGIELLPKSIRYIPIKLASHRFVISMGNIPMLMNREGEKYPIIQGKNYIGRSPRCEITVSPSMADISRRHLLVEYHRGHRMCLTDYSSLGTYVSETFF